MSLFTNVYFKWEKKMVKSTWTLVTFNQRPWFECNIDNVHWSAQIYPFFEYSKCGELLQQNQYVHSDAFHTPKGEYWRAALLEIRTLRQPQGGSRYHKQNSRCNPIPWQSHAQSPVNVNTCNVAGVSRRHIKTFTKCSHHVMETKMLWFTCPRIYDVLEQIKHVSGFADPSHVL